MFSYYNSCGAIVRPAPGRVKHIRTETYSTGKRATGTARLLHSSVALPISYSTPANAGINQSRGNPASH